jgi:hypothetical protein
MKKRLRLILEFSEFNAQRFNSDNTSVSVGTTQDPSLSINAFDRHEDSIRVGMSRINNIMKSLSNTSAYRNLKSKLTFENQKPSSLKILRIIPSNVDYNVYLNFIINEVEYDGVIKNILSKNPELTSNVFKTDSLVQNEEWQIRLKGLIINSFKKFIDISKGEYRVINDKIICYNVKTGAVKVIPKGSLVEVIRTMINENKIVIKHDNEVYNLTKDNFIYFNYWFEKA